MVFISHHIDEWTIFMCLIASCALFIIIYVSYRPLFPMKVTCWFCNGVTRVPYGNRNCWDCPLCDQYNGFTKDGDYNKPIPAQFDEALNHPVECKREQFLTHDEVLCLQCAENQATKIRLLAQFEPVNERSFDEEVVRLTQYLEDRYKLCATCEKNIGAVLEEQDRIINSRLNDSLRSELHRLKAERDQYAISPFLDNNNSLQVRIGFFLHMVESASSLGLTLRQIQLDTGQTGTLHQHFSHFTSLHGLLLKLDVYEWDMVFTMITSGILAKVLVTRERMVFWDFVNGIFLLLVLFTLLNLFPVFETGSPQDAVIFTGCLVTSILCLFTKRKLYNPMYVLKPRGLTDSTVHDSVSSCNSSVNQSSFLTSPSDKFTTPPNLRRNPPHYQPSPDSWTSPSYSVTNPSLTQETSPVLSLTSRPNFATHQSSSVTNFSHSLRSRVDFHTSSLHSMKSHPHSMIGSSKSKKPPAYRPFNRSEVYNKAVSREANDDDGDDVNLSYTVFKLESFNLGSNPPSYPGSRFRARSGSGSSHQSSRSSYAGSLTTQELPRQQSRLVHRPLIAPSHFSSTVNHERQTHPSMSHVFRSSGLPQTNEHNVHKAPSNTGFQGKTTNSGFLPRSPSPLCPQLITQFGTAPYPFAPLPKVGHSGMKGLNYSGTTKPHRTNNFTCLRETIDKDSDEEMSDNDSVDTNSDTDDSVSDFTSVSQYHTDGHYNIQPVQTRQSPATWTSTKKHWWYTCIVAFVSISIILVKLLDVCSPQANT